MSHRGSGGAGAHLPSWAIQKAPRIDQLLGRRRGRDHGRRARRLIDVLARPRGRRWSSSPDRRDALRGTPYQGLSPTRARRRLLLRPGRTAGLIIANLKASRLTLLYGASGVGKSSVLRAGVGQELREHGASSRWGASGSILSSSRRGAIRRSALRRDRGVAAPSAGKRTRLPPGGSTLMADHSRKRPARPAARDVNYPRPVRGVLPLPPARRRGIVRGSSRAARAAGGARLPDLDPRGRTRPARPLPGPDPEPVREPTASRAPRPEEAREAIQRTAPGTPAPPRDGGDRAGRTSKRSWTR